MWSFKTDLDPKVQADIDKIYLDSKVILPEEVRTRNGMPELTPEQEKKLNPPPPPMIPGMAPPALGPDGKPVQKPGLPGLEGAPGQAKDKQQAAVQAQDKQNAPEGADSEEADAEEKGKSKANQ